jgi:hypothetical protein
MRRSKIILGALLSLLVTTSAEAGFLEKCDTIYDVDAVTATASSSVYEIDIRDRGLPFNKPVTAVLVATVNSGTTPTLDTVLQSCETTTTSTCSDIVTFTQCTTGTCRELINLNQSNVNIWPRLRAVNTLGGTSPNIDIQVRLCYAK